MDATPGKLCQTVTPIAVAALNCGGMRASSRIRLELEWPL